MPQMIYPRALSWVPEEQIEETARNQIQNMAQMPFIFDHLAIMPDCHYGMGATVGSCVPTKGAIIPGCVGVDIGCGMVAVRTPFTYSDMPKDLSGIREAIEEAVPLSAGVYNKSLTPGAQLRVTGLQEHATKSGRLDFYNLRSRNWPDQIGSLGSGNHFIEITLDENERVWTFLHSGSRGIGNKIAEFHIKVARKFMERWFIDLPDNDLAYLIQDTQEFKDYMTDLIWAQKFALQNRAEMTDRVLQVLRDQVGPFDEQERIECHHNFTQWENHKGTNLMVTRKGAIEAREGQMGLIPGSMGTASYVVRGKGNKASFNTAPHGAGRRMARGRPGGPSPWRTSTTTWRESRSGAPTRSWTSCQAPTSPST